MQQPERKISSSATPNDDLPEDDIDQLFRKLEFVEPPPALIARILSNVSELSQAELQKKRLTGAEASDPFDGVGNLVVRNEKKPPS